jgi:hypothetical protein
VDQHRQAARKCFGMMLTDDEADALVPFLGDRVWKIILGEKSES